MKKIEEAYFQTKPNVQILGKDSSPFQPLIKHLGVTQSISGGTRRKMSGITSRVCLVFVEVRNCHEQTPIINNGG